MKILIADDHEVIRTGLASLLAGTDIEIVAEAANGKEAIKREIEEKVPALLADGGYVPLADGRIRDDVPFENYAYYRRLLETVTQR